MDIMIISVYPLMDNCKMQKGKKVKTVTFYAEKGGIGKSSLAFNMAWELSKSKRVLLIDMDGQSANLTFFCNIEKADGMVTLIDLLTRGSDVSEAIVRIKDNLDIIGADSGLALISPTSKISVFKQKLREIEKAYNYDYVFIDVSPSPNWSHNLSLAVSDGIIVPMLPDVTSLQSIASIIPDVEETKETVNPALVVLGLVYNRAENRTTLSKQSEMVATELANQLNTTLFQSRIRQSVKASECVFAHIGVTDYDSKCSVADDFRGLVAEFEARINEQ